MNTNYTNMMDGVLTLLGKYNRFLTNLCEVLTPFVWYVSEII
jgi:hypothetical protein